MMLRLSEANSPERKSHIYFKSESLRQWCHSCLRAIQSFYSVPCRLQVGSVHSMINELFYAMEEGRGIKEELWRNESEKSVSTGVCVWGGGTV